MSVPLDQFVCNVPSPACPLDCECIKIPYNCTYVVRCPEVNNLPPSLPNTEHPGPFKCRYDLDFSGSKIHTVDYFDYFNNTVTIDISSSFVSNITDRAWRGLVGVSHVDLSSNNLTVLPTFLWSDNLTFCSLSLYGNPWRCQCGDRWIRTWMESLGSHLNLPESVLCAPPERLFGKSVLSVTYDEFCAPPFHDETTRILEVSA